MKVRYVNDILLNLILIVTLAASVNGSVWNRHYCQALPITCETPKVILKSGTAGTSTIYMNSTSAGVSVSPPEVQISIQASWSADTSSTQKYPNDGGDWIGQDGGYGPLRIAVKFPLDQLPSNAVVTGVNFTIYCYAGGAATHQLDIHPYNDTGQGDPEVDSASTAYSRCAPSGVPYVDDSPDLCTVGSKELELSSASYTDVENAKSSVSMFSLGLHEEGDDDSYASLVEYSEPEEIWRPTLHISYKASYGSYHAKSVASAVYRSNTGSNLLNSPKLKEWNGTMWSGSATEMDTAGSSIRFVRTAYNPTIARYYESVVIALSDDGYLNAYVWNGSSWLVTNNIGCVGTTANAYRAFDVAYEKTDGYALLVYGVNSTDPTKDLAYKIWNNTQWSSEGYIDDPGHSTDIQYYWVALAQEPLGNEVALIALDYTDSDINGWVWNGTTWGNYQSLEETVENNARLRECLAVSYEQTSGRAMFVWAQNDKMQSRRWSDGWKSELPEKKIDKTIYWLSLKADPKSDRLMLVSIDKDRHLYTVRWDGSSWTKDGKHDDVDSSSTRGGDFEWEPSGGKGLLVYARGSGKLKYRTFNAPSTWGSKTDMAAEGTHYWIQLRSNPRDVNGDVKILGAMLNSNNDLGALKWDGSTLTNIGDSLFTSDTTVSTYECFDIAFRHFEPSSYDYVLKVVNQVTDNWQVNMEVYDSSNIGRLSSLNISFHDGITSNQIVVTNGVITQSEGNLYDLAGSATIYISMSNLQATTSETSYLYLYLKILVPSTSTYNLFVIAFEIT